MGFTGSYTAAAATVRSTRRAAAGIPAMDHHAKMLQEQPANRRVHDLLQPQRMLNGRRECRPSATHPNPVPIIIAFDATGSMAICPTVLQQHLGKMIDEFRGIAGVESPQVLVAAFDDAFALDATKVLQVGQFEPGEEMENDLSKVWLTGAGGGTGEESSDLVLHFAAHHTDISACGRKGYLFIFTDERPYSRCPRDVLTAVFGTATPEYDLHATVAAVREKYEVFILTPSEAGGYGADHVERTARTWNSLFPGRHMPIGSVQHANTVLTAIVGVHSGALTVEAGRNLLHNAAELPPSTVEPILAGAAPAQQA